MHVNTLQTKRAKQQDRCRKHFVVKAFGFNDQAATACTTNQSGRRTCVQAGVQQFGSLARHGTYTPKRESTLIRKTLDADWVCILNKNSRVLREGQPEFRVA